MNQSTLSAALKEHFKYEFDRCLRTGDILGDLMWLANIIVCVNEHKDSQSKDLEHQDYRLPAAIQHRDSSLWEKKGDISSYIEHATDGEKLKQRLKALEVMYNHMHKVLGMYSARSDYLIGRKNRTTYEVLFSNGNSFYQNGLSPFSLHHNLICRLNSDSFQQGYDLIWSQLKREQPLYLETPWVQFYRHYHAYGNRAQKLTWSNIRDQQDDDINYNSNQDTIDNSLANIDDNNSLAAQSNRNSKDIFSSNLGSLVSMGDFVLRTNYSEVKRDFDESFTFVEEGKKRHYTSRHISATFVNEPVHITVHDLGIIDNIALQNAQRNLPFRSANSRGRNNNYEGESESRAESRDESRDESRNEREDESRNEREDEYGDESESEGEDEIDYLQRQHATILLGSELVGLATSALIGFSIY